MAFRSAAATAAAIKAREVSPVEVVQAYLDRIQRLDSRLCSYITVCGDQALAAARRAERALSRGGQQRKPLLGVPIAVKDQFWTKGIRTTNGSRVYRDFIPAEDDTVVKKLKQAGAILLGKLNLSELAMGGTQQHPFGIPRNPWALERSPGESSSGSGVALAAHLCAGLPGRGTPEARGGAPLVLATWWGCGPPSLELAATALPPCAGSWTPRLPWPRRWRTAACFCRPSPAMTARTFPPAGGPSLITTPHLKDGVRGLCVGLIRELHGARGHASRGEAGGRKKP